LLIKYGMETDVPNLIGNPDLTDAAD